MCDFRKYNKIKILKTGEIVEFDQGNCQHFDSIPHEEPEKGMYHVGVTGCGYQYFDGEVWVDEYNEYYKTGDYYIVYDDGIETWWGNPKVKDQYIERPDMTDYFKGLEDEKP